jgi:hypothetical protein
MDKEKYMKVNGNIHVIPPDADVETKTNKRTQIIHAVKSKTYTQEEVLAILAQIQKGQNDGSGIQRIKDETFNH